MDTHGVAEAAALGIAAGRVPALVVAISGDLLAVGTSTAAARRLGRTR